MIKFNKDITQEELKNALDYNSNTGVFRWKKKISKKVNIGQMAGYEANCRGELGYWNIRIFGTRYFAHRLAWLYEYGYLPENFIDHIDRNKLNNAISNLREVISQCNLRNTGNWGHNTSGVKGVTYDPNRSKWASAVQVDNKRKYLGRYTSFDNAVCARLAAEQCLNWSGCDSSSPAYRYVQNMLNNKSNLFEGIN